ncbi:MAG: large-conductance mechanosensitive channel protein MscL [Clostridia bacterium]|nr:large-conductance mechanosensitive channel protein MscL [Clostridia bacterium]
MARKKSTFWSDFKAFIAKGNVVDMAVGVVIGGAFKDIVNALVNSIIMPVIGIITGGKSIEELKWVLKAGTLDAAGEVVDPEIAIAYGAFLQTIIDFLIIALCIFTVLRVMMKMKDMLSKKEKAAAVEEAPAEPAETTDDILKDIRELLKK